MNTQAIDLLFLEVDMSNSGKQSCGACDIAKSRLNAALDLARPILAEAGYEVRVNQIVVTTEEEARELSFFGSPTLRVSGSEVAPRHVPESEGRLWSWAGKDFSEPPVGLFLDLILQGLRTDTVANIEQTPKQIPTYLRGHLQGAEPGSNSGCAAAHNRIHAQ